MKKSFLAVFLCCTFQLIHSAGTRNAIFLFNWGKETVANDFNRKKYSFNNREFGPVTQSLLAALAQQAAPIIVSSTTWRNAIERGKMFDDIVHNRDISYLQNYKMLQQSEDLHKFAQDMRSGYDVGRDLMGSHAPLTAVEYYTSYQTFYASNPVFKPNEWIIKQLSDYLYLLIPKSYLKKLEASKDTPAIARSLTTKLTPQERTLGMKFTRFNDIAAANLLDPQWHAGAFAYKKYKTLVPESAAKIIEKLLNDKLREYLKGYFFGQHVNHMLAQLFVTRSDLKSPGDSREETDINEALFLHEWLVYIDGHGSLSDKGPVMPVVYEVQQGRWTKTSISIAYLAGLELGAFRQLLGFLNNRVRTGALVYTSCYSGGKHLFKLYEHQWDYPKTEGGGRRARVRKYTLARQDVFNYFIIATNLWYKVTQSSVLNYWSSGGYYNRLPGYRVEFDKFFIELTAFLYPKPAKKIQDKYEMNRSSRSFDSQARSQPTHKATADTAGRSGQSSALRDSNKLIDQLTTVLKYIHSFSFKNRWQVPAIRFPYTEWFVALDAPGVVVRLEEKSEKEARKAQERKIKQQLEAMLQARKEKELFERMEKMRKEQERRQKAKQPPIPPVRRSPSEDVSGARSALYRGTAGTAGRAPMTPLQRALFRLNASLQQLKKVLQ